MRSTLTLLGCLSLSVANAITVNIQVNRQPVCTYATGQLIAVANGGVGPYAYLWSNGETTAQIMNVPAGPYSVTVTDFNSDQATDNINLMSSGYDVAELLSPSAGLCGVVGAIATTTFGMTMSTFVPPPPYLVDGVPMFEIPPDFITSFEPHYVAVVNPTNGYGQDYAFSFEDGAGCTGTISGDVGWPVEWPGLAVLDVQGSCSGGNNGTITFQTGLEGHHQVTAVVVKSTAGVPLQHFYGLGSSVATRTAPALAPGDYWLVQFMSTEPWFPSSGCGDSILVSVPALGNTCGNVSGLAYMDYDENCTKQGNEPVVPGTVMEIQPGPYYAVTSTGGTYSLNLPLGSYTIEQQSATLDEHCTGTPIPFTLSSGAGLANLNIPDTSLVTLDAMLTMVSGPARPGFPVSYALEVENLTPASTGAQTITFTFDPILGFNSASPTASVVGNVITWTLPALGAFQRTTVHASLQVPPDILLLGVDLLSSATVTCANTDADLGNNSTSHTATITGAYDPNDKLVRTSSGSSDEHFFIDLDEFLDYTIRFQNTGTDTAFNIVVTDVIAPELDLGSFIAGASSHAYSVEIREGNMLRFAFYNIQLPDSNVNEPASHGFVSFRIRPQQPLLPGTGIINSANIYFDFNPPVITEPSVLTAEFSTEVQEQFNSAQGLRLQPNPASDELSLSFSSGAIAYIRIVAMDGREVLARTVQASHVRIDLSCLRSGPYIADVVDDHGITHHTQFIITRP